MYTGYIKKNSPFTYHHDFPMTKYAFAEEKKVIHTELHAYRAQKLALYGVEAAKNPFDIDLSGRDCSEQFMNVAVLSEQQRIEKYSCVYPHRIRRKLLTGSYANMSEVNETKLPTIVRYAWKAKINKLRDYLNTEDNQAKVNKRDGFERTALHVAASWADHKMLEALLAVPGVKVNADDCDGKTPLRKAVEINSLACVKLLIEHNADCNIVAKDKRNPFDYALEVLGDYGFEIISFLFKEGRMSEKKNLKSGQFGYLHQLALVKRGVHIQRIAKYLVSNGVFVNATDGSGKTPLMLAAKIGRTDLIGVLLKCKADVMHADLIGRTAIDYVIVGSKAYYILKKIVNRLSVDLEVVFGVDNRAF